MKYIKAIVKVLLGAFMLFAGITHLTVAREEFVAQVPVWIQFSPGFTDFVVLASGVMEILLGTAMLSLWKEKGRWAGAALALFYVLIFPGNINQYVEHINAFGLDTDQARLIRLFFQPVLVFLALWSTSGWSTLDTWVKKFLGVFKKRENKGNQ